MTAPIKQRVVEALNTAASWIEQCPFDNALPHAADLRALAAELEGMAIVPREATQTMLEVGGDAIASTDGGSFQGDAGNAYRAMLSAAEGEK